LTTTQLVTSRRRDKTVTWHLSLCRACARLVVTWPGNQSPAASGLPTSTYVWIFRYDECVRGAEQRS